VQTTASTVPFTAQLICNYKPIDGAKLPEWARTKAYVYNNRKAFFKEQRLFLISP